MDRVGHVPVDYMKGYGKGILIKACDSSQDNFLKNFRTPSNSNIESISPAVFGKELFIQESFKNLMKRRLQFCPNTVYQVRKLRCLQSHLVDICHLLHP